MEVLGSSETSERTYQSKQPNIPNIRSVLLFSICCWSNKYKDIYSVWSRIWKGEPYSILDLA